ncbi:MAG: hypothetical protein K2H36_04735 [Clostridia bacterium]|nr:hypothetical protein [Clostridia bacterium]MDE6758604.1 hypothetical protein [Clostridia bacterium]
MEFIDYKNYGKCVKLSKGGKTMLVTVDIGPRVIFYGMDGGENIFYEDHDDLINKGGEYFDTNLPGKGIWHIYGGHRLWKSPEYIDTYYPDNSPVQVKEEGNGVIFTSEIESTTGIQKSIKITMDEEGNAILEHKFVNCAQTATPPIALWTLSVMDKGAVARIPLNTEDKGLLPNRNLVLWSYTDIKDERLQINNDCVILSQKNIAQPIKLGMFVKDSVCVDVKGMKFTIDFDCVDGDYADYCCNVETYTNDIMLEIETLSPIKSLQKGESAVLISKWRLEK